MAGRNTAAAGAAFLLVLQIWESLINGKYMREVCQDNKQRCPTCNSSRECNNYFCLQCQTGGLCPLVFGKDHEHSHHPWLQVRLYTKQYSVLSKDLAHFISEEGLKHIHTIPNKRKRGEKHCNLSSKSTVAVAQASCSSLSSSSSSGARARARAAALGGKSCQGCMATIPSGSKTETFLVCSLQCLMKVARERSEFNLLAMKAGAMEPMNPPLSFPEKVHLVRYGGKRQTPTATPTHEASPAPPPQATGDSPMLESHEILTGKPIVEAPPSPPPPATGDSSVLQFHEIATRNLVMEAPPSPPQATGDYRRFYTPEEEAFVDSLLQFPPEMSDSPMSEVEHALLQFPPVTEDFPMFEDYALLHFPPAPEDFPMFEDQDLLLPLPTEIFSISEDHARLLPLTPEDFLMFEDHEAPSEREALGIMQR